MNYDKIEELEKLKKKNWFFREQKRKILNNLDKNIEDEVLSLPKTNLRYMYLNSWSIKCSIIGIIFTLLIMIGPYIFYKNNLINENAFIIIFFSIFFISVALMIINCNYNNSFFITRKKLNIN